MNCSSCETLLAEEANYCSNCGHDIKTISKNAVSIEIPDRVSNVQSFAFKIVRKLPMPYWISMMLFWQLLLAVDFLLVNRFGGPYLLMFNFFLYTTFAGTMIVIEYANRQLQQFFPKLITFVDAPQEAIIDWYSTRLHAAFNSRGAFITGIIFVVLGALSTFPILVGKSDHVDEVVYYRLFTTGLGFFVQGAGTWSLFSIIVLATQLAKFKINVKLFAIGNDSVMALGNVFLRLSLAISIIYSFIVLADIIGGLYTSYVIIFWNVFAVFAILCFFIVPQYRIHKLMVKEKQIRLKAFTTYLEQSVNECLRQPSKEKLDHLKGLFELKEHLSEMHEWSFKTRSIGQLISVLLIPLLLVILEVYLSK